MINSDRSRNELLLSHFYVSATVIFIWNFPAQFQYAIWPRILLQLTSFRCKTPHRLQCFSKLDCKVSCEIALTCKIQIVIIHNNWIFKSVRISCLTLTTLSFGKYETNSRDFVNWKGSNLKPLVHETMLLPQSHLYTGNRHELQIDPNSCFTCLSHSMNSLDWTPTKNTIGNANSGRYKRETRFKSEISNQWQIREKDDGSI